MTEREIFLAALDLPDPTARASYLDRVCRGDLALRAQVESLLRSHDTAGSFLGSPAVNPREPKGLAHAPQPPDATQALDGSTDGQGAVPAYRKGLSLPRTEGESSGDDDDGALGFLEPSTRPDSLGRLGHYEMLEVLGRGAFGIVFRAFDDSLQRVVAIKVMAPQIATLSPRASGSCAKPVPRRQCGTRTWCRFTRSANSRCPTW